MRVATDTEHTAETFSSEHRTLAKQGQYFRFNVQEGLEHIGLEEHEHMAKIVAATRRYVEGQHIYEAIISLKERVSFRNGM